MFSMLASLFFATMLTMSNPLGGFTQSFSDVKKGELLKVCYTTPKGEYFRGEHFVHLTCAEFKSALQEMLSKSSFPIELCWQLDPCGRGEVK